MIYVCLDDLCNGQNGERRKAQATQKTKESSNALNFVPLDLGEIKWAGKRGVEGEVEVLMDMESVHKSASGHLRISDHGGKLFSLRISLQKVEIGYLK